MYDSCGVEIATKSLRLVLKAAARIEKRLLVLPFLVETGRATNQEDMSLRRTPSTDFGDLKYFFTYYSPQLEDKFELI